MLATIGRLQVGNSLSIHESLSVVSAMLRRTYRYKSLSLNFPARAGGLVAADIKGEAAGGTLGTVCVQCLVCVKSDCKCWWKACSAGLLRASRNAAATGCAHIAGPFLNIRGGTFALSCKQHPHALLGPDAAGDLIISPRCPNKLVLRRLAAPNAGGCLQALSCA